MTMRKSVNILSYNYLILLIFFLITSEVSCGFRHNKKQGVVVIIDGDPGTLDPRFATSGYGVKISHLIFAGITRLNTDFSSSLYLGESVTQDGTKAIIRIKPNLKFANGSNLTIDDFIYTIISIQKSIPRPSPFAYTWKDLLDIKKIDNHSALLTFSKPHPHLMEDLQFPILPSNYLKKHGNTFKDKIFGAGPFMLTKRDASSIELQANPFYFQGVAKIKKVIIRIIEEENIRALLMVSKTGDLAQNVLSPLLIPSLKKRGLVVQTSPSNILTYIGFNLDSPKLSDIRVRKAIALAINRKAIIKARFGGMAKISDSIFPQFHWAHTGFPFEYNPEKAKKLLDIAGFPKFKGKPRLVLEYKTSSNPFRVALARLIAKQLHEIGIKVKVRSYEWGVFYNDLKHRRFEMVSLQMPEIILPDVYCWFFASWMIPINGKGGGNRWGFRSAVLDHTCKALEHTINKQKILDFTKLLQKEVAIGLPIIPLWHEDNIAVTSPRFQYKLLPTARFNLYHSALTGPKKLLPNH